MAMHQGFDLSRFKKVSSDKNSTTMRHANGHEVKIVHSALSAAMRSQIDALPTHEAPVKMARGGAVKKMADGGDAMDNDSPAQTDDGSTPEQASETDVSASSDNPESSASSDQPPTWSDAEMAGTGATFNPANVAAPGSKPPDDSNIINVTGVKNPAPQTPTMQSLTQEQQAWQNDLSNGHITPETYQSLFAKKDTLSKLGTIFGLMVGGGPSQNTAYQMMNNEIQNDMRAQIHSKSNAVNYYNAATTMAQGMANADHIAANTGLVNARLGFWQSLLDNTNKLPPGQFQQRAQQAMQQMFPLMQQQNAKDNARAVMAANQNTGTQGSQPTFSGPVNGSVLEALKFYAPEIAPAAAQEGQKVFQTRTQFDNYTHAYKRLNTITAGQGPQALKIAADVVAATPVGGLAAIGGLTKNVSDLVQNLQQERDAEIQAMPGVPQQFLPSGYDYIPGGGGDATRAEKANRAAAFFKLQEGMNPTLNMLQSHGYNVVTPQPYDDFANSMKQKKQPRGIGGRSQPLATPEQAAAGNVFPDQPKGSK